MKIIIGCEESQAICKAFREKGYEAYSCDVKPCSGGRPEWHLQMDVFTALVGGHLVTQSGTTVFIEKWDAAIFHPECTFLTCSAEWAYKDGPYHQKVKPGTLVGQDRRMARQEAKRFFMALWSAPIDFIAMENPVGVISQTMKPAQTIQPYMFGADASKATCLWLKGFPKLVPTKRVVGRMVMYKGKLVERWANQTDSGQNRLSPGEKRSENRSKTYPGIAEAIADQWGNYLLEHYNSKK